MAKELFLLWSESAPTGIVPKVMILKNISTSCMEHSHGKVNQTCTRQNVTKHQMEQCCIPLFQFNIYLHDGTASVCKWHKFFHFIWHLFIYFYHRIVIQYQWTSWLMVTLNHSAVSSISDLAMVHNTYQVLKQDLNCIPKDILSWHILWNLTG